VKEWYASVNHGLEPIIGEILKDGGARHIKIMDSAITFSSAAEIKSRCINNLFAVLSSFMSESILDAAKKISRMNFNAPECGQKTFRVIIMDCGKLRAIPGSLMTDIERNVSRQTGLSADRANPGAEIWLNRRNDKTTYFMVRAHKHAPFEKTLKQGELRPDVAAVMVYRARIGKQSAVADMFGGWGGITAALIETGRYGKIYTGDINHECVRYQQERFRNKRGCIVQKWDALALPLADRSIDSVITDPPWGEYEDISLTAFYNGFIKEAARVLRPGGSLIFLTSAYAQACRALSDCNFSFDAAPLKINGKNAFLFVCALN